MVSDQYPNWEDFQGKTALRTLCEGVGRFLSKKFKYKINVDRVLDQIEKEKYEQLLRNLDALKAYYENETGVNASFSKVFEQTLMEIYFKRLKNKQLTWNFFITALESVFGFLLTAGVSSAVLQIIQSIIENIFSEQTNIVVLAGRVQTGLLIMVVLLLFVISARWFQKHCYKQTWTRHSESFHRLNLALVDFLYATERTEKDRKKFERKIFHLWDDNLSRFASNMNNSERS